MTTTTTTTRPAPDFVTTDRAVRSILSDNTKLRKLPDGSAVINAGVTMAPAKRSGVFNVCPHATAGCIAACVLWFAGRTVTAVVRAAAVARTKLWYFYPDRFYDRLDRSLRSLAKRAAKLHARAFCRLNVASDIDHPRSVMERHPAITFYDYTKSVDRCLAYANGELAPNYHLSYSLNENTTAADLAIMVISSVNVIVVFDSYYFGPRHRYGVLPARVEFRNADGVTLFDLPVVDGDAHDLRTPEHDGRGVVVGLRLKGGTVAKARAIASGFARHFAGGRVWHTDTLVREGVAVVTLK